ncbi:MAG TPA: GH25 family lysozyme [Thermoanaerobaculia bacterium]|jgi:lysozyme|nr:GH25 family lysozyme [Thermoanaerobaculia bacterium]
MPEAADAQAQGIDVSQDQGTVDWSTVAQLGYVFAFIKATDGETYVDPDFAQNWTGAAAAGVLRGAYHFFRAEDSPQAQVDLFWKTVGGNGELPLVVDVEESMGVANATLISNLTQFLAALEQASGRTPMIYTDPNFWNGLGTTAFGGYPLWVAEYGVAQPTLPAGWANWAFWQHSETGSIPGIQGAVDLNVFNGAFAALQQAVLLQSFP